jgi:daunorubicin resistance ABC transporter membrane protein
MSEAALDARVDGSAGGQTAPHKASETPVHAATQAATATSVRPANRGAVAHDLATVSVLWRRDLTLFAKQKSRVLGTLLQPLIFWLVIGSGMASTFRLPGTVQVGYMEYFFPGIVLMIVLFTAIFAATSIIEDRHDGFLQAVLAAPGSRTAVVLGKTLGSSTVALIQAALLCAAAPLAGFALGRVDWLLLALGLTLATLGLVAIGFAMAWWLDSTQAYHVVMSVLLLPLWVLSGAMFPPSADHPALLWAMRLNPMSYAVDVVRAALYGGHAPAGMMVSSVPVALGALAGFFAASVVAAVAVCYKKR